MSEIEEFQSFHPRAVKLLRKKKNFLVVAEDEPYFSAVYALIRAFETAKGTWTKYDESCYRGDVEHRVAADRPTLELLRRIQRRIRQYPDAPVRDMLEEIDAVLESAGGG